MELQKFLSDMVVTDIVLFNQLAPFYFNITAGIHDSFSGRR